MLSWHVHNTTAESLAILVFSLAHILWTRFSFGEIRYINFNAQNWKVLSSTVNTHKDRVNKQKEKGESLRIDISTVDNDIKKIKRGQWITWNFYEETWNGRFYTVPVSQYHRGFLFYLFFISDDTEVLIESAKTAASASNSTVSNITERLRNISQEVDRITLTNGNTDNILTGADQACEYSW